MPRTKTSAPRSTTSPHAPELKERYNVMSVPCVVIDDGEQVLFGRKNIEQLLDALA
ncbi:MAG: thioredoxin family protein [Slackia sp.]